MSHSPYRRSAGRMSTRFISVFASLALVGAGGLIAALPASAAIPAAAPSPSVSQPFDAPECAGTTVFDPTDSGSALGNDLQVTGPRLDSYNAGNVVPLYDSYGGAIESYPPLCGVRYVDGVGPVSEWMYCTDLTSLVCGDTDAEGNLVEEGYDEIALNPLTDLVGNDDLNDSKSKIIAYLIQNGHAYEGVGNQRWDGVTEAQNNSTTNGRNALQSLIWCVSDTPPPGSDLETTCARNMDADEQAAILAKVPATPSLIVDAPTGMVTVGNTAKVTITTNVYEQPITVNSTPDVDLTVCDGDADLADGTLTVHGIDTLKPVAVTLCLSSDTEATLTVDVTATPASTEYLTWHQSQNNSSLDDAVGKPCQVFSTFNEQQQKDLTGSAEVVFAAVTRSTTESSITTATAATSGTPTSSGESVVIAGESGSIESTGRAAVATKTTVSAVASLATTGFNTTLFAVLAAALIAGGLVLTVCARSSRKPGGEYDR